LLVEGGLDCVAGCGAECCVDGRQVAGRRRGTLWRQAVATPGGNVF